MGSVLFFGLNAAQHGENELDQAVVTQLAQGDQFRSSGHDNPKRGTVQNVVDVHENNPCVFTLAVFQYPDSLCMIIQAPVDLFVVVTHVSV